MLKSTLLFLELDLGYISIMIYDLLFNPVPDRLKRRGRDAFVDPAGFRMTAGNCGLEKMIQPYKYHNHGANQAERIRFSIVPVTVATAIMIAADFSISLIPSSLRSMVKVAIQGKNIESTVQATTS